MGATSTTPSAPVRSSTSNVSVPWHRRRRELDLQVVHVVAVLVADQQRVAEPGGGDEPGPPGLALDQRVRDQRRGVDDRRPDVGRVAPRPGRAAARRRAARRRAGWRGVVSVLSTTTVARRRVEQHDVGERAADVDGQPPVGSRSRSSGRGWREHVEDPALAVLVVADEDRVAVPDRRGARYTSPSPSTTRRSSSGSPMRKSSPPRTMIPSCSWSVWWWRNEPVAPPVDPPEAQLQLVAGDHPAAEAGRSVSANAASS